MKLSSELLLHEIDPMDWSKGYPTLRSIFQNFDCVLLLRFALQKIEPGPPSPSQQPASAHFFRRLTAQRSPRHPGRKFDSQLRISSSAEAEKIIITGCLQEQGLAAASSGAVLNIINIFL